MKITRTCLAGAAVILSLGLSAAADDWAQPLRKSEPRIKAQARDLGRSMTSGHGDGVLVSGKPFLGLFDSNVPEETQDAMRGDLAFVKGIQGNGVSNLHQRIFGAVNGPIYMNFFKSHVRAVGLDSAYNSPGAMAYVSGDPSADHSKMWLTSNYIKFSLPQVERVEIIFHEARHTEMEHEFWPHARCPTPFLDENGNEVRGIVTGTPMAGHYACDTTPFGSYGSGMIMIKNIQKFCSNCGGKVLMDAGLYGDDTLKRMTDPKARKAIEDDLYR